MLDTTYVLAVTKAATLTFGMPSTRRWAWGRRSGSGSMAMTDLACSA